MTIELKKLLESTKSEETILTILDSHKSELTEDEKRLVSEGYGVWFTYCKVC